MAEILNPPHGKTVHATFIPFERMTRQQQAEHITIAHGMNADYWDGSTGDGPDRQPLTDDASVIAWYLTGAYWVKPGSLEALHADDHDYLADDHDYLADDHDDLASEEGVLACVHTHDKEA